MPPRAPTMQSGRAVTIDAQVDQAEAELPPISELARSLDLSIPTRSSSSGATKRRSISACSSASLRDPTAS